VSATVLISPSEHLTLLKGQTGEGGEVIAFADSEALQALAAITRKKPNVVALEQQFAATSRGAALINRIKADPSLSSCEIRIVTAAVDARSGTQPQDNTSDAITAGATAAAVADPPAEKVALDKRGTRRSPRFKMAEGAEISIDGNPAMLVDMSIVGAMALSQNVLRPNQRVRLSLLHTRAIRFSGRVAWASFEMPKGQRQYRAGIEFFDADPAAVQEFLDERKK
jgi:CheY-like chemotaxis protein